jgi:hypothetical protein
MQIMNTSFFIYGRVQIISYFYKSAIVGLIEGEYRIKPI